MSICWLVSFKIVFYRSLDDVNFLFSEEGNIIKKTCTCFFFFSLSLPASNLHSPLKNPLRRPSHKQLLSCKPPQNVRRIFCVNGSWKVGLQEENESNVLFNPEPRDDLFCFSSPKSRNQVGILMIYRKWSVTQILENRQRFWNCNVEQLPWVRYLYAWSLIS